MALEPFSPVMLRPVATRNAASFGFDESCAARSVLLPLAPPGGGGDAERLVVSIDGDGAPCVSSWGDPVTSPDMLSPSACDRSRPMPSIERGEGRKRRTSVPEGRREDEPSAAAVPIRPLDPLDVVVGAGLSASDTSSSVSRADMERDSRSPRPPSAARMGGRPSAIPFDVELSRERG